MVLSWVWDTGCPVVGPEFAGPPKSICFGGQRPLIERGPGFFLYIPTAFNFRAVDAIMVSVNGEMTAAIVVCVQITIAKSHSGSGAKFFSDWQWWKRYIGCPERTFRFLRILENVGSHDPEDVSANHRITRSRAEVTHPAFRRSRVTVRDISRDIGAKLTAARASRA